MQFKEYFIGKKGRYHNRNVTIISIDYDPIEYEDFGFNFKQLRIKLYYDDGSKIKWIKGNEIKKGETRCLMQKRYVS